MGPIPEHDDQMSATSWDGCLCPLIEKMLTGHTWMAESFVSNRSENSSRAYALLDLFSKRK